VESKDLTDARLDRQRTMAMWAVERWAGFPVDQDPRPLVFTGSIIGPEKGFRTGEAKLAFLRGAVEVQSLVPEDVLAWLRHAQLPERHPGRSVKPLVLTGGTKRPCSPPTEVNAFFRHCASRTCSERSRSLIPKSRSGVGGLLSHDGAHDRVADVSIGHCGRGSRSTTTPCIFRFRGGDPRWVDYPGGEVIETDQTIAVIPIKIDHGPQGPRHLIGYRREVVIQLRRQFGNRVLVNLDASPVEVVL
jgi:hypothetical protein